MAFEWELDRAPGVELQPHITANSPHYSNEAAPRSWRIFIMATNTKVAQAATKGLAELFLDGLKDIYYAAEKDPEGASQDGERRRRQGRISGIPRHLVQTQEQVARLERVFDELGVKATGETCPAIDGILEEGEEILHRIRGFTGVGRRSDRCGAGGRALEIARYGALIAWAEPLVTVRPPICSLSHSARK